MFRNKPMGVASRIAIGVTVVGTVVGTWFLLGFVMPTWLTTATEKAGQLGDQFGAVSSLFSGLGFAGLVFTLYLQIESMAIQRDDANKGQEQLVHSLSLQAETNRQHFLQAAASIEAAKLSAHTILLQSCSDQLRHTPSHLPEFRELQNRQQQFVNEVEASLSRLNKGHENERNK